MLTDDEEWNEHNSDGERRSRDTPVSLGWTCTATPEAESIDQRDAEREGTTNDISQLHRRDEIIIDNGLKFNWIHCF